MVIIGDIIAVAGWIWAYDMLRNYNQTLAIIVLVVIFTAAIIGTIVVRCKRNGNRRDSGVPDEEQNSEGATRCSKKDSIPQEDVV